MIDPDQNIKNEIDDLFYKLFPVNNNSLVIVARIKEDLLFLSMRKNINNQK